LIITQDTVDNWNLQEAKKSYYCDFYQKVTAKEIQKQFELLKFELLKVQV